MSRHGKIARLPLNLREELNQRLLNGEPGEPLLAWLNPLPEVQTILKEQFAGIPISKQNLHEWRSGGFAEWEFKRDLKYDATETKADGAELEAATGGYLADHLAMVLAARYASLVRAWSGEATDEFKAKLKVLRALVQDVSLLRRWDHNAAKVSLAQDRLEDQRQKAHEEKLAELTRKAEREQDFQWALESLTGTPPAKSPPPAKPAPPTTSSHTSHSSHSSHPSLPAESPAPPPVEVPVTASRESAADLLESNPVKVSQSTFTSPAEGSPTTKAAPPVPVAKIQVPPAIIGESNPTQGKPNHPTTPSDFVADEVTRL